ncbi:hypothetical protein BGX28_005045 [Mortierella sp. GBA30]|nr:hypothetical protein BGX28_005045 [Mortierella sp. GBA30]
MLNSLKKPAAASATKKTLTPTERAEAVAAAVAAAQVAQNAKKTAGATAAIAKTAGSKTNGRDSKDKDSKENKDTNESTKEEGAEDEKEDEEEDKETEKGQNAEAKAAMKNMTGYQQETEREGVDSDKLEKSMAMITDLIKKQKAEKASTHKEGEKITLSKDAVELVVSEMDLPKAVAEKHLKEHGGDVTRTLQALVSA